MKVLVATPMYPPELGGPATRTKLLEEKLPEHGIEVAVVSFGSIRWLPWGVRHGVFFIRLLQKGRSADVLLAQDAASVGLPTVLAGKLLRKPVVLFIVGDFVWEQGTVRFGVKDSLEAFSKREAGSFNQPIQILKWGQTWVAKQAKHAVVPSEYFKKIVSNWGVPKPNIVVIPNAVSDLSDQGNRKTLRGLLKFNGKFVISAGRLIPLKRFDALIKLVPAFVKKFPNFKLLIVGRGPEHEHLEGLIRRLKLENHVVLTGALEQDVLFRYIKAADLFVLNSTHETFPHVLLETMSIGTPLVATRVGGVPEIVEDTKSGLLVRSGDRQELEKAVVRILSESALSGRLSRGGLARAKAFSEEVMVASVVKILKKS